MGALSTVIARSDSDEAIHSSARGAMDGLALAMWLAEALVIERIGRGVLDAPLEAGHPAVGGALSTVIARSGSDEAIHCSARGAMDGLALAMMARRGAGDRSTSRGVRDAPLEAGHDGGGPGRDYVRPSEDRPLSSCDLV